MLFVIYSYFLTVIGVSFSFTAVSFATPICPLMILIIIMIMNTIIGIIVILMMVIIIITIMITSRFAASSLQILRVMAL